MIFKLLDPDLIVFHRFSSFFQWFFMDFHESASVFVRFEANPGLFPLDFDGFPQISVKWRPCRLKRVFCSRQKGSSALLHPTAARDLRATSFSKGL